MNDANISRMSLEQAIRRKGKGRTDWDRLRKEREQGLEPSAEPDEGEFDWSKAKVGMPPSKTAIFAWTRMFLSSSSLRDVAARRESMRFSAAVGKRKWQNPDTERTVTVKCSASRKSVVTWINSDNLHRTCPSL